LSKLGPQKQQVAIKYPINTEGFNNLDEDEAKVYVFL
jgi:hypothetical protein